MQKFLGIVSVLILCAAGATAETPANLTTDGTLMASLLMSANDEAPAESSAPAPLWSKGSWSAYTYAFTTFGEDDGEIVGGRLGLGYYFDDDWSINVELVGAYIDVQNNGGAQGDQALAGGLDLMLRWHFLKDAHNKWSIYMDGGCGFIYSSDSFPANGTNNNWTPQLGVGGTLHITDNTHFMGGVRWWHASNARRHGVDRNPTYDSIMIYTGLIMNF